jgi:hypothetical protein
MHLPVLGLFFSDFFPFSLSPVRLWMANRGNDGQVAVLFGSADHVPNSTKSKVANQIRHSLDACLAPTPHHIIPLPALSLPRIHRRLQNRCTTTKRAIADNELPLEHGNAP